MRHPTRFGSVAAALVGLALTVAIPALAQSNGTTRQNTPARTSGASTGQRDGLNFVIDASEDRGGVLAPDLPTSETDSGQVDGYSSMLTISTDYYRTRRRTQFTGTALTSFRYYPQLDRAMPVSHSAGLTWTTQLPARSTLELNSSIAYAPAYLYQLLPKTTALDVADAIPADPDYRIDQRDSYSYGPKLTFGIGSPRRTRITATADYRRTDFDRESAIRPNLTTSGASLKASRAVTRNVGLSLDYEYRVASYYLGGVTTVHSVTLGSDYTHRLSATRRLRVSIKLSPSMLASPTAPVSGELLDVDQAGVAPSDLPSNKPQYLLQGGATVDYEFSRRWRASAAYRREVQFLPPLTSPLISDATQLELNGMMTRRLGVSAAAGYGVGSSPDLRNVPHLYTTAARIGVQYSLRQSFNLHSEYLYYHYDFQGQSGIAPNLLSAFERQSVRVGLTLFVRAFGDKATGRKP